jgi:pimeloyl-ACP methyl ester carboxylesterase
MSALPGVEERRIPTSDGEISFVDVGEGEAVLLLRGSDASSDAWSATILSLAARFRVLAPDPDPLPLSGEAGSPSDPAAGVARVRRLLDHVGVSSLAVIGQGEGGAVAQLLAIETDTVRAMVLIGSAALDRDEDLAQVDVPALLLWGEDDRVAPTAVAERLHDTLPGASLALLPGCGHDVLGAAADTILPIMAEWMRSRYLGESHSHAHETSGGPIAISIGRRPSRDLEFLGDEVDDGSEGP